MSRTNNGEIVGKRGCLMGRPRSYVRKEDEAMEQNEQDPPRNGVYSRPSAYFDGDGTLVVRASAAAGCRRALWYAATEHEPTNPPTDEALTVMEAGTALEPVVLRAMERAGWDVIPTDPQDPQTVAFQIAPNLKVTGHADATGVLPLFGGDEVIVEVKPRGPSAYRRWQVLGAERSHPESVAQAALYTYGSYGQARDVVIATMDTGSREWDVEVIPADRVEVALERVRSWLGELADHYTLNGPDPDALPERDFPADDWHCRSCPFLNTCLPGNAVSATEVETATGSAEATESENWVTRQDAQAAVAAYEAAQESTREPDRARREALDILKTWMRQQGLGKTTMQGRAKERTVSLVQSKRYSVNYRKLNEALDPETREEIVTEHDSEYVRVS